MQCFRKAWVCFSRLALRLLMFYFVPMHDNYFVMERDVIR